MRHLVGIEEVLSLTLNPNPDPSPSLVGIEEALQRLEVLGVQSVHLPPDRVRDLDPACQDITS
jgi:hypothetical protein